MPITTTIMPQFIDSFIVLNHYISIVMLQLTILYCSDFIVNIIMLMRKFVPHIVPSLHDHYDIVICMKA